jgi:sugar phosphate isomerase/epimerase
MESGNGSIDLLDVPRLMHEQGFHTLELCHFHVPDTSASYLRKLRANLHQNQIELWSLLIDDGDIAHPDHGDRDAAWTREWIDRAETLGSKCVRISGGKQPPTERTLGQVIEQLGALGAYAAVRGVNALTENWHETMSSPEVVKRVVDETCVGLCFDFGNWSGPDKYKRLEEIAPLATSCHAKCEYVNGQPNRDDFCRCLEITKQANFDGPYTLVHGEPGRVWKELAEQRELLQPYL